MRILYDATVFRFGLNGNSCRSGIFMVARELLHELVLRDGLEIELYAAAEAEPDVRRFVMQEPGFQHLQVNPIDFLGATGAFVAAMQRYRMPNQEGILLKALASVYNTFVRCLTILASIASLGKRSGRAKVLESRYHAFLSPMCAAPDFVVWSHVPRYTVLYDTIPQIFPDFCPRPAGGELWQDVLLRSLRADDYGFAISQVTKRDFLRYVPQLDEQKIKVIPLGASPLFNPISDPSVLQATKERYGIPADRPYFLSLCTIEPRKNLSFALRAFAEFAKTDKSAIFVVSGGGWQSYQDSWDSSMSDVAAVRDRIVLTGYVDDQDLPALYSGASAFVFLSLYEGFGLPPLEAMQCGTPVLSSNTSSLPEVVGDAAYVVAPDDLGGTVTAMKRLISDAALRTELREKGVARAKLFSWRKAVDIITTEMLGRVFPLRTFSYVDIPYDRADVFLQGFSVAEDGHRWSDGMLSVLRFSSPSYAENGSFLLKGTVVPFLAGDRISQRMIAFVNGRRIGERTFTQCEVQTFELPFCVEAAECHDVVVCLALPDAISPRTLGLSPDARKLALSFVSVSLLPG